MAKKSVLELPAQAGKDIASLSGIAERWANGAEGVIKESFEWGKKHKLLVLTAVGLFAAKRYLLDDPSEEKEDSNEY